MVKAKPHIGTDLLRDVVRNIRKEILRLGGQILFDTRLTGLLVRDGVLYGVETNRAPLGCSQLVLAVGHSARDTFQMLYDAGVPFVQKPFSVGVRIEHLQQDVDRALYGPCAGDPFLPPAEYQYSLRQGEQAVYTFCMCPGGTVVAAASEQGGIVTNGMSSFARDLPNANSALVASVSGQDFGDGPFAGLAFQRRLEQSAFRLTSGWRAPCETVGSFLGTGKNVFGRVKPQLPNWGGTGGFKKRCFLRGLRTCWRWACGRSDGGTRALMRRTRCFRGRRPEPPAPCGSRGGTVTSVRSWRACTPAGRGPVMRAASCPQRQTACAWRNRS